MERCEKCELQEKLQKVVMLHDKLKKSYLYTAPPDEGRRKEFERKNHLITEFEYQGESYKIVQSISCKFGRIFYSIIYEKNGQIVNEDIRTVKKILNEITMNKSDKYVQKGKPDYDKK